MTKITVLAIGSRGDVQPLLALSLGLRQAGYDVTVAGHLHDQGLIRTHGFDYTPVRLDFQVFLQSEGGRAFLDPKGNPVKTLLGAGKLLRAFEPLAESLFEDCYQASRDADALLGVALLPGNDIAEARGIQSFSIAAYPFSPTGEFPNPLLPLKSDLHPILNRLTYSTIERFAWFVVMGRMVNRWRSRLHLPAIRFQTSFDYWTRKKIPYLYAFSPTLVPKPKDWPARYHVTGAWFLPSASDSEWLPPQELVDFIQSGETPIYIGFGSMSDANAEQRTETILAALEQTCQRAVVLTGWGGMNKGSLPESVFAVDSVPHDWLFPQMKAIIHHGGAGTTVAAVRAGVPSMVLPFLGDQFFWGRQIAKICAGIAPIPMKDLNPDRLAQAINRLISNVDLRQRAVELGRSIQAEDGVSCAVKVIDQYMKT